MQKTKSYYASNTHKNEGRGGKSTLTKRYLQMKGHSANRTDVTSEMLSHWHQQNHFPSLSFKNDDFFLSSVGERRVCEWKWKWKWKKKRKINYLFPSFSYFMLGCVAAETEIAMQKNVNIKKKVKLNFHSFFRPP